MTERQTLSFISKALERAGLHPKTKYGQNFLVDLNLLDILVKGSDIQKTDVILEVGTGMGSLSKLMAPLAGAIVTVEIDRDLQALAAKELRGAARPSTPLGMIGGGAGGERFPISINPLGMFAVWR